MWCIVRSIGDSPGKGSKKNGDAFISLHRTRPRPLPDLPPSHRRGRGASAVVCVWLILQCAGTAYAATRPGIDAVLVMDSSGSMKTTDPQKLRIPAAKLFISLLGKDDRVGVISFSDDGYPVIGLTPAHTKQDQARLFRAVDKYRPRAPTPICMPRSPRRKKC